MATEWSGGSLGELVDLQRGITYKSDLLGRPGPVLLGLASIQRNGGFRSDSLKTYGGESPQKLILRAGDMYVSLKDVTQAGDLVGAVSRVPNEIAEGRLTQDTVKLIFKREDVPRSFVYWLLRTPEYRSYCRARAIGTTNLSLTRGDFLALPVPAPSATQLSLVALFDGLESKIELNMQMNATLEAIAQAVFKRWFVDFQFPGFDGELVDGLPKGWRVGKLSDVVEVKGGATPSTKGSEYWDGEFYWATPKDLSKLESPVLLDTERKITKKGVKQISSGVLPKGTLLLSSRAPIGYLAIAQVPVSINQGFIAIQGKTVSNLFMLFWLKQNMGSVESRAGGSTFQEINKANFREIEIVIPTGQILRQFDDLIASLFDRMVINEIENRSLVQLRDSLLPKLMSGKIRVA